MTPLAPGKSEEEVSVYAKPALFFGANIIFSTTHRSRSSTASDKMHRVHQLRGAPLGTRESTERLEPKLTLSRLNFQTFFWLVFPLKITTTRKFQLLLGKLAK